MNKRQKSKRNSYGKFKTVLAENTGITVGFVALENNIDKFNLSVKDIDDTNLISVGGTGRINQTKTQTFTNLVQMVVGLCKKAESWANDANNPELEDFYHVTKSDFDGIASSEVIAVSGNVIKGLNRDIAQLVDYNITSKHITDVTNLLKQYENESPAPILKIKKTAEANKKLVTLFNQTDVLVKKITNLIEGEYENSHPDFVGLVQSAKALDTIGSRGTKVTMIITDKDGKPVADALGDILEMTDEEQYSDANGELIIEDMKGGDYHYEVTKNGIKVSGKFSIKAGEQLKIKVVI